jgi:thiol-disulfide isomerase/thioredoxin
MKGRLLVALILAGSLLFLLSCARNSETTSKLPDVELKDLAGRTVNLRDFQGKPLLVNFWATSCGPCRLEIPMLNELHRKYGKDLVIVGISLDLDGADSVREFGKEVPIEYKILLQTSGLEKNFAIWAIPTTYFYDRQGTQVEKIIGLQTRDFLERTIQTTIAHRL